MKLETNKFINVSFQDFTMKQVKLTTFSKDLKTGKIYEVYLGNGTAHFFSSEQLTKQFLAKTSKYLTGFLHEIHELFQGVWKEYQDNWFYFQHNKKTMCSQFYEDDRTCRQKLRDIEDLRDLIVTRSEWNMGPIFSFKHSEIILNNLKQIIKILTNLNITRSNTNELYKLKSLYRRTMVLKQDLQGYGEEKAIYLFEVPKEINEKTTNIFKPIFKVA